MPQFDLTIYSSQMFWLVVCFSTVMIYTLRISVPRLKALLEERWQQTEGYRITATKVGSKKDELLAHVEKDLAETRKKALGVIKSAQTEAAREITLKKNHLLSEVKTKIAETEQRIKASKVSAYEEIKPYTQEVTISLIEKVLPLGFSENSVSALLDDKLTVKVANDR